MNFSKNKVLILGAKGFLGSVCMHLFRSHGMRVITSDIQKGTDITGDLSSIEFVNTLPDVDIVINCAAVQYATGKRPVFGKERFFEKNNVVPAKNLYLRYQNSDIHFIHVSSSMVFEDSHDKTISSFDNMVDSGFYAKSKVNAQRYIDKFNCATTVFPVIIVGKGRGGLFELFVKSIDKSNIAVVPGAGSNKLNIVHVNDVADFIFRLATKRILGKFFVSSNPALTIQNWIDQICNELKREKVLRINIPLKLVTLLNALAFNSLLSSEQLNMLSRNHIVDISDSIATGWQPKISPEASLRETARFIVEDK